MNIVIISGSVRPGNASARVSKWVENVAKNTLQDTEVSVVDLATLNLPRFEEAIPPMMNDQREPTGAVKQWLDALGAADGYVFVTPEYNHGMSGALKDAIDYIGHQIMKKPFMVVSHGGIGGARAGASPARGASPALRQPARAITAKKASWGSASTAKRPNGVSMGCARTVPPRSTARATAASVSSTAK